MSPSKRIEMMRVGDIMVLLEAYPRVLPTCTLGDAAEVMEKSRIEVSGTKSLPRVLLVIDEKYRLKGTARRRDIMRGLEPKFLVAQPLDYRKKLFDVSIDPNLSELSYDKFVKGVRERASRPVSDVMKPVEMTLDFEDHIIKAVYEMVSGGLSILPVTRNGRVVGIVRSVEVFHEMAHIVHKPDPSTGDA
jgi:predicted transcriptional regulator